MKTLVSYLSGMKNTLELAKLYKCISLANKNMMYIGNKQELNKTLRLDKWAFVNKVFK